MEQVAYAPGLSGQQQRVALARALVMAPKVLLFDEPLSNLDAKLREQMRPEIRRIQQTLSITSVYVTHDQAEAMMLSDRIVVMNKGSITQIGTAQQIYRRPANAVVADFIGKANFLLARDFGDELGIDEAATCVNVIVRNLDKAEGVRWLSRETSISLGAVAAVGDSPGDVSFMRLAARPEAPANAHASVKEIARYTSPFEDGLGLVDILGNCSAPSLRTTVGEFLNGSIQIKLLLTKNRATTRERTVHLFRGPIPAVANVVTAQASQQCREALARRR